MKLKEMKLKERNAKDRIQRVIDMLEKVLEEIEAEEAEDEQSRKEEIEEFFNKLEEIRCTFSWNGEDNIRSIHFTGDAKDNSEDVVIIAISKEKARNVI